MINYSISANFYPPASGLNTVGYTINGGSRVTSGVTETVSGTGRYGAVASIDPSIVNVVVIDTGQNPNKYAIGTINPVVVAPQGLRQVVVETNPATGNPVTLEEAVTYILYSIIANLSGTPQYVGEPSTIIVQNLMRTMTALAIPVDGRGNRTTDPGTPFMFDLNN